MELEDYVRIALDLVLLVFAIWTCIWAYKDSQREGKPGWLVVVLIMLSSPIGLFLWLVVRSEKLEGRQPNRSTQI